MRERKSDTERVDLSRAVYGNIRKISSVKQGYTEFGLGEVRGKAFCSGCDQWRGAMDKI